MTNLRPREIRGRGLLRSLVALLMVLVCVLVLAACEHPIEVPAQAGDRMPYLRVAALDGGLLQSTDWLRRFTVLNLWATWCTPCRAEMPSLERLNRSRGEDSLRVVAISLDSDPNLVREFVLEYGLTFSIGLDPEGRTVTSVLGAKVLPETWVIDDRGLVLVRKVGIVDWDSPPERERMIPPMAKSDTEK